MKHLQTSCSLFYFAIVMISNCLILSSPTASFYNLWSPHLNFSDFLRQLSPIASFNNYDSFAISHCNTISDCLIWFSPNRLLHFVILDCLINTSSSFNPQTMTRERASQGARKWYCFWTISSPPFTPDNRLSWSLKGELWKNCSPILTFSPSSLVSRKIPFSAFTFRYSFKVEAICGDIALYW